MAKIVITDEREVWRVSRRVLGARTPSAPGLIIARSLVRLVSFPALWVLCLLGVRAWRVEARTADGRPVVWYVRGTGRARRVAREAVAALVAGRPLDTVLGAVRDAGEGTGTR